jgi:hypothetical protein
MRNPIAAALALRAAERLSESTAPSRILLVTASATSAREVNNLAAAIFPIGSHELRAVSQGGLLKLVAEENARRVGLPLDASASPSSLPSSSSFAGRGPGTVSQFEARAALHSALHALPLDRFYRPANAPFKYLDALHRHFEGLARSGVGPDEYAAARVAHQVPPHAGGEAAGEAVAQALAPDAEERHAELSKAYAAWLARKGWGAGGGGKGARAGADRGWGQAPTAPLTPADLQLFILSTLRDPIAGPGLAAAVQAEVGHVHVLDGDEMGLGTLRLLHAAFGAGTPAPQPPAALLAEGGAEKGTGAGTAAGAGARRGRKAKAAAEGASAETTTSTSTSTSASSQPPALVPRLPTPSVDIFVDETAGLGGGLQTARRDLLLRIAAASNAARATRSPFASSAYANSAAAGPADGFPPPLVPAFPYAWTVRPLDSVGSLSSAHVAVAVRTLREGKTLVPPPGTGSARLRRVPAAAAGTAASPAAPPLLSPDSVLPASVWRESVGAQYVQTLPKRATTTEDAATSSPPTSPQSSNGFVECVGLAPRVREAGAVARTVAALLQSREGRGRPVSIAVMCRTNAAAEEMGLHLQAELASFGATVTTSLPGGTAASDSEGPASGSPRASVYASPIDVYADGHAELSRVPEVRWLIALLGVLVQPRDQSNWYTLASSPLYAIPLPAVADWVRSALADPLQAGSMLRVVRGAAAPESRATRGAAPARKRGPPGTHLETSDLESDADVGAGPPPPSPPPPPTAAASPAPSARPFVAQPSPRAIPSPLSPPSLAAGGPGWTPAGWTMPDEAASDVEGPHGSALPPIRDPADSLVPPPPPPPSLRPQSQPQTPYSAGAAAQAAAFVRASNPSAGPTPIAVSARRLLDDLITFSEEFDRLGSVALALASYAKRIPAFAELREPTTVEHSDAAAAVSALLTLVARLERQTGSKSLKAAARLFARQVQHDAGTGGGFSARPDGPAGARETASGGGDGDEGGEDSSSFSSPSTSPVAGLASVFGAVKSAVYTGRLRYSALGRDATRAAHGAGPGAATSGALVAATEDGDADEEVLDLVTPVPLGQAVAAVAARAGIKSGTALALADPSALSAGDASEMEAAADIDGVAPVAASSSSSSSPVQDSGMSAADAAAQQTFAQLLDALQDETTQATLDRVLADTGAAGPGGGGGGGSSVPAAAATVSLHAHLPGPVRPFVVVTTLQRGIEHQYDIVLLPNCAHTAYPGRFAPDNIPAPLTLFCGTAPVLPTQGRGSKVAAAMAAAAAATGRVEVVSGPLPPRPYDRAAHEAQARAVFDAAVARARQGVIFFCPGVPTPDSGVSSRSARTKWLDSLFGVPPSPASLLLAGGGGGGGGGNAAVQSRTPGGTVADAASPAPVAAVAPPASPAAPSPLPSLSFSSLSDYEWCPRKYKFRKIDGLVPLPASNAEYGKALHAAAAACAEMVVRPVYTELDRMGVFADAGLAALEGTDRLSRTKADSDATRAAARLSMDRAAVALEFLRSPSRAAASARQSILRLLPPVDSVVRVGLAAYKHSWIPAAAGGGGSVGSRPAGVLSTAPTFGATVKAGGPSPGGSAAGLSSSASSSSAPTSSTQAWAAALPWATALPPEVATGALADDVWYVRAAVDALLLNADEIRAYEPHAREAIGHFAARELREVATLLGGGGDGAAGAPPRQGKGLPPSLLALLEQHFRLVIPLPGVGGGVIELSGFMDRVDVVALPAHMSPLYRDGADTFEPVVREFKSGQQWKKNIAYALREKLRSLQPDIYGMAVRSMLGIEPPSPAGAGRTSGATTATAAATTTRTVQQQQQQQQRPGAGTPARPRIPVPPLHPAIRVAVESIELGVEEARTIGADAAAAAVLKIAESAASIQSGRFDATPGEIACTYCGFNTTCDTAFGKKPSVGGGKGKE